MFALVKGGNVLQVFRQPRPFRRHAMVDVPVRKSVPDPNDKTWRIERRKQRQIEVTETVQEMDELQYPVDVFTKWTEVERRAIGILPMIPADEIDPAAGRVTGYRYEIEADRVVEVAEVDPVDPAIAAAAARRSYLEKRGELRAAAAEAIAAGIPWEGDIVQIDERSRAAMAEQLQRFALTGETRVAWRMASNRDMTLNVEQFRRMYGAALKRADEVRRAELQMRAGLDRAAAAGIEEVRAFAPADFLIQNAKQ